MTRAAMGATALWLEARTWAEGRYGGGIELDGTSGYISVPDFELTTDTITLRYGSTVGKEATGRRLYPPVLWVNVK